MKLITYRHAGQTRVGVLNREESAAAPLPFPDMNTLIEVSSPADLRSAADAAERGGAFVPLSEIELLAPIPRPRQDVICLATNYRDHAAEAARYSGETFPKNPPAPVYFGKRVNEAVAPGGYIERHPGFVARLDYETELAFIIGRPARNVPPERAGDYVFGYTILNDVSARELQTARKQWFFGKSLDSFAPMGPCILTADETAFPPDLSIRCRVNGELRQDGRTSALIAGIPEIIADLSAGMTLLPGTIISTGTPAGVGMGFDPPRFLNSGDTVECEIERIGVLRSTVR